MLSICKMFFMLSLSFSLTLFSLSVLFLVLDLSVVLELSLLSLHSSAVVMTFLFDWMSLVFMSFVFLFLLW